MERTGGISHNMGRGLQSGKEEGRGKLKPGDGVEIWANGGENTDDMQERVNGDKQRWISGAFIQNVWAIVFSSVRLIPISPLNIQMYELSLTLTYYVQSWPSEKVM